MYDFAYQRATSVADAVAAIKANPEAKVMAGGLTLIPVMKQRLARPALLVDLAGIGTLKAITAEGGTVSIGALATHDAVATSPIVEERIPALAALASGIGDPQVRNRGTLGGSIANHDPAADYPAAMLALDAAIHTDRRVIAAADFFTGLFETALEPDEIVVRVNIAVPDKAAYAKFDQPASRYALVGVFVARAKGGAVRVAVTGAGPGVFRVPAMEQALARSWSPDAVAGIRVPADGINGDIHGSAEYRAHLVTVLAKRAVIAAG
jgi:carbon-monoxide dehydrogenase medium subunit